MIRLRTSVALSCIAALAVSASAFAQGVPPVWNPANAYNPGDLVRDISQNYYRNIKPVPALTAGSDPSKNFTYWELASVRTPVSLNIGAGQTFPSFKTAWQYLAPATISQGVPVQFKFISGTGFYDETFGATMSLNHEGGQMITIVGDNALNVRLHFPKTSGFFIDGGHNLGGISNVTLDNASTGSCSAIYARNNASITVLDSIKFTGNWQNLIFADSGATIGINGATNQWSNTSSNPLTVGVLCSSGALVRILGNGFSYDGLNKKTTFGFFASLGGKIEAAGTTIKNCTTGINASNGSSITIPAGKLLTNALDIKAVTSSNVFATGATYTTKSIDASSHLF